LSAWRLETLVVEGRWSVFLCMFFLRTGIFLMPSETASSNASLCFFGRAGVSRGSLTTKCPVCESRS
ncbi:hypothetical protein NDU88_008762, partial [Pleurodeles waltl]